MTNNLTDAKTVLDSIIEDFSSNRRAYVKNPEKDFTRDRKLTFENTIRLILSMKGGSLSKELYEFFDKNPEKITSSSAFVQQRDKLTDNLFYDIFMAFNQSMIDSDSKKYKGYRLLAVDGSDINVAYDETADTYIKPAIKEKQDGTSGKGFNQYHLNALYDLLNHVYLDATITPRPTTSERREFISMVERASFSEPTLYIADRGYPAWNVFAHFKYKDNADYLIRVKNSENTLVSHLPMEEFDIDKTVMISTNQYDYGKPNTIVVHKLKGTQANRKYKKNRTTKPTQWDFSDNEILHIRIVRFKISDDTYETIFTSLPKDKFSIAEIKELYHMRWGIETSFRELKYILGLTNLHGKKDAFVKQEIWSKLIMYNMSERVVSYIVVKQDKNRAYTYQVNFTMAITFCLDFFRNLISSSVLLDLIHKHILPIRPGRQDKRKLRAKSFVGFLYRVAA